MIGVHKQAELVVEVVDGLVHPTASSSYNLVVPPGFGENAIAKQIAERLAAVTPRPLVAVLAPDTVKGVDDYLTLLHDQWSDVVHLPPQRSDAAADARLKRFLHTLPTGRPVVQIIKRFHRFLDSLDRFVLGTLRDAENARCLRTVTISPFGYDELKKRWERAGQILLASDYGDTHSMRQVDAPSEEELRELCRSQKPAPMHVIELASDLTGGYPEPFRAVVERWIRMKEPELTANVRRALREEAVQRMGPLVRKLDRPKEQRYRDSVVDLYQGSEETDALQTLAHHPWKNILLKEDALRAEALGEAAVRGAIEDAVNEHRESSYPRILFERARTFYQRKKYDVALGMLEAVHRSTSPGNVRLLEVHARVMAILYASNEGEPGMDTDWGKLRMAVEDASKVLAALSVRATDADRVKERYREIQALSSRVQGSLRGGNVRIVDTLAGFRGDDPDPRTAALLLLLKLEAARAIAGDALACMSVLALPEQIFRVWALWALKLDYYRAPDGADETWQRAEAAWPHGTLTRTTPGDQFASFEAFAYFALARWMDRPDVTAPEHDFKALNKAFSVHSFRRDAAHALTHTTAKAREQLFALIDRWLEALLARCDVHEEFTRAELFAQVEPLPILDDDGSFLWLS
ncbi:hypothetical protein AB3662_11350 [Sorangium cellulosum]|uniref:hypothetical protein n=1 Tax=Sorangium cellulosum TaxID=56 RepID=UPI003D9A4C00